MRWELMFGEFSAGFAWVLDRTGPTWLRKCMEGSWKMEFSWFEHGL